jgi:phosphate/sulfate permease
MTVEKYYIRVAEETCDIIENLFMSHHASYCILSKDMANGIGTTLYSVYLTGEQALIIKLSCPLVGCLNFGRALGKLVANCV